jgi:hypothetical protein
MPFSFAEAAGMNHLQVAAHGFNISSSLSKFP